MTVTNALSRFVVCPLVVALSDVLLTGIQFTGWAQWVFVGLVLAVADIVMDMTLLDRLGHVGSFIADVLGATILLWLAQFVLPGAVVTWTGALGGGVLLGLSEIGMHAWIQAARRRGVRASKP